MPPLYVPNGSAQCLIRFRLAGDPEEMAVTIGVEGASGASGQDLAVALDEALTDVGAPFADATALRTDWSYEGTIARLATAGGVDVGQVDNAVAGTGAGGTLPPNSAILMRKVTGLGGRKNRGRMYLPPYRVPEANISNTGFLDPLDIAAVEGEWNVFLAYAYAHADIESVDLFHYPTVAVPTPAPTPIAFLDVQPQIATRRLRLRP